MVVQDSNQVVKCSNTHVPLNQNWDETTKQSMKNIVFDILMTEITTQTPLLFDVFLLLEGNADTCEEFSNQNQFYHPKKVPHLGKDEHELAFPHNLILQFECFLEGPNFQSLK